MTLYQNHGLCMGNKQLHDIMYLFQKVFNFLQYLLTVNIIWVTIVFYIQVLCTLMHYQNFHVPQHFLYTGHTAFYFHVLLSNSYSVV